MPVKLIFEMKTTLQSDIIFVVLTERVYSSNLMWMRFLCLCCLVNLAARV